MAFDNEVSASRWRIDRNISISIIIGIIANALIGVWYAARLDQRVATVETWTRDNVGTERRLSSVEAKIELLISDRKRADLTR